MINISNIAICLFKVLSTPVDSYQNSLLKVYGMADNYEQELALMIKSDCVLQDLLLLVATKMHKIFPIKWTNKVFSKLHSIGITSPRSVENYYSILTMTPSTVVWRLTLNSE